MVIFAVGASLVSQEKQAQVEIVILLRFSGAFERAAPNGFQDVEARAASSI